MATPNKTLEQVSQGMVRADVPLASAIDAVDACIPYQLGRYTLSGKTSGATSIYVVPTGKKAIITAVIVRASVATSVTSGFTFQIGANVSTYDDLVSSLTTTLDAVGEYQFCLIAAGFRTAYAAASVIKFNATSPATGTTLTLVIDIIGYLV